VDKLPWNSALLVLLVASVVFNASCAGSAPSTMGSPGTSSNSAIGGSVSVTISPASVTTTTNGTVQFTANVAVSWSVASGGGTVSSNGLYTAPPSAGTATVVATSVANPSASALANVTINAPVTIVLSASPSSIAFGSVVVGSSASQAVKLSNSGNAPVTVSSATTTGSGFGLSGLTFPFTLAMAATQTATVTFGPASSGMASGSVSFVSNAPNSPVTVALSGSGTAALVHSVTLSWQPSMSTVSGYNVYRTGTSGGPYARLNSALDATDNYVDLTIQSGHTYYYVVTSVDSAGLESGYSNQVTAVIPSP